MKSDTLVRSTRVTIAAWALGLAVVIGGIAAPAAADQPISADESRWGYQLAHELMSPFCPGRTLAACTSDQAAALRQEILIKEASGMTRADVIAELEREWGDAIHSAPDPEGWGLAAWLLPGAVLILGAGLVWIVLQRMVGPTRAAAETRAAPATHAPTSPETASRVPPAMPDDAELERLVDAEFAASSR